MSDQPTPYGSYPQPAQPAASDLPPHSAAPTAGWADLDGIAPGATRAPAPKKHHRRPVLIGGAVAALLLAGAGVGIYSSVTKAQPIEDAVAKCKTHAQPEDEGHTLTIRNASAEENPGPDAWGSAECVLAFLKAPSRVMDHIGQTRAMDGTQTDSWEQFTARWTFHPDHGTNITITDSK
jgi:hypothetical protein